MKIDKSFVDEILVNEQSLKMIKNIIKIGKDLGLKVLAEGVETEQQVLDLAMSGCDLFQGYYFSKPLSLSDLKSFILRQRLH